MRIGIIYSMDWSEHALAALQDAGLRRGGARRAVVEFLERQDCCRSAQEIHDGIVSSGGAVGVASVYRTLDTLAELRLVQRVERVKVSDVVEVDHGSSPTATTLPTTADAGTQPLTFPTLFPMSSSPGRTSLTR